MGFFSNYLDIRNYDVYKFHYLDDLRGVLNPSKLFEGDSDELDLVKSIKEIEKVFKRSGWEGDGNIGVIWIPPFMNINNIENNFGEYLWHVKQLNNGTSFIAAKPTLKFERFSNQKESLEHYDQSDLVHIMEHNVSNFKEWLSDCKLQVNKEIENINLLSTEVIDSVREKILAYNQNEIIGKLHEFMDGCYLNLLNEVINNCNRSSIYLKKSTLKIDFKEFEFEGSELAGKDIFNWFTQNHLISSIWKSYKHEPFDAKFTKLINPLGFKVPTDLNEMIKKHVLIRNCIQHHDWQLDWKSLEKIGKSNIKIQTDKGIKVIEKHGVIFLDIIELNYLIDELLKFVNEFDIHVNNRILTREYK